MMRWWIDCARCMAVIHALRMTKGNRTQAAKLLGITVKHLFALIALTERGEAALRGGEI